MMSKNAAKALDYYKRGLWTKSMLQALVKKGFITQEEYEVIVGGDE